MSPGVLFVWKVSCFYEKVHDFSNFRGCAAILWKVHNNKAWSNQRSNVLSDVDDAVDRFPLKNSIRELVMRKFALQRG